jgi:Zn finger protein HypA/HybF involved in hydrogenase expression
LHVRVGPASGVVVEALRFAFDVAKVGTPIESVDLAIDERSLRSDGRDLEVIALEVFDAPANC